MCALAAQHNSAHPIIDQIRKLINNSNKDIEILWIPGHCGIPGNEKVDKCAKEILQDQPQNDIPCPASDYLNHLHSSFRTTLQLVWDLNPHYHLHQIKPRMGHWPSSNRNTKLQEIILARLRVGHTSLTHYHIFEHSPSEKKSCRIGVKILTALQDCEGFLYVIVQDFLTLHGTLQGVLHGIL